MNEKELYEKQYGEKKLITSNSFPVLRRIFKKYDLHREDLALSFLEGGEKLLDVGCGNGALVSRAKKDFPVGLEQIYLRALGSKNRS